MAFVFKLQTLLNWKKSLEELAQKHLADLRQELQRQEEEIQDLIIKRITYDQEVKEKSAQGIPAGEYMNYQEFLEQSYHALVALEEKKKGQVQKIEEARKKLLALIKEKKVLEKLRDKRFRRYMLEMERKVQAIHDERAVQRHHSIHEEFFSK
jgi:flagellar protein FliJ